MRVLIAAIAVLAAACNAPQEQKAQAPLSPPSLPMEDAAGNRMEVLAQRESSQLWCSADGAWCVESGAAPRVLNGERSIALPAQDATEAAVWPFIVRFEEEGAERALVGLAKSSHQMYSGGGAESTSLSLFAISGRRGEARHVLTMPASGAASIRACFNELDEQARRGACLDEYKFQTRVTIDETTPAGVPRIVLETAASTYPGRRSRQEDSTQAPPLQQSDLQWAADATCSYRRVFTRGADGAYAPDQPLPQCSDYLEP